MERAAAGCSQALSCSSSETKYSLPWKCMIVALGAGVVARSADALLVYADHES
jgi:hypothetical protein